MKLLAGRVGQIFDYSSMASDVGVDAKTIKSWLSLLEASFNGKYVLKNRLNK